MEKQDKPLDMRQTATRLLTSVSDFIGACLLALYALFLLGPLGFLKGPLVLGRSCAYLRLLLANHLLARSVRVAIDWRLGNFDSAIAQAEEILATIERSYLQKKTPQATKKNILGDFYTLLTRAYMHAGRIDEAMQTILRAKKHLGIERLVGLSALDAKTANLVRAGLAAGKLLEGDGVTTMFVKARPTPPPHGDGGKETPGEEEAPSGQVIQFPSPE